MAPAVAKDQSTAEMVPVARQAPAAEFSARIPLTGAGEVAFDPSAKTLAWASGASLRMRDLSSGDERSLAIGSEVDPQRLFQQADRFLRLP